MPISRNKVVKSISPKSIFDDMTNVIDNTTNFKQGDNIVLASNLLITVTSGELGTNFVGVARVTVVNGQPVSPYQGTDVDASAQPIALAGPEYGSTMLRKAKVGDAFPAGCPVYIDGNSGTDFVTSTSGSSKVIGVHQGPAVASAVAGQEIEVLIGAVYPNADAHF